MTSPGYLGSVEVDVELNVRDLGPRLRRALRDAGRRAGEQFERDWSRFGRDGGDAYGQGFRDRLRRTMGRLSAQDVGGDRLASAMRRSARTAAQGAAEAIERELRDATRAERLLDIDVDIRKAQQRIEELERQRGATIEVDADIRRAQAQIRTLEARRNALRLSVETEGLNEATARMRQMQQAAAGAASALGSVIGQAGRFTLIAGGIGAAAAGLTALTTGALSLGAALGQAAGTAALIPAALAGVAAGAATIRLATVGLEDAFKALSSDDPAELAAAMERLAPAAQNFVRAIRDVAPAFDRMRLGVQQRMFEGIGQSVGQLATTYLPLAERMFNGVAQSMNRAVRDTASFLDSQEAVGRTERLVDNVRSAWDRFTPALQPAVDALLNIATVGSDFMPRLAGRVTELSERFAAFIDEAERTGELAAFMERSIQAMNQLGRIAGNVGGTLGNIFSAANASGMGLLDSIERITQAMRDWTGSVEGQAALGTFFDSMRRAAEAAAPVVGALVSVIGNQLAPALADIVERVAPGVEAFIRGLGEAIDRAAPGVSNFADSFGGLLQDIAPLLPSIGEGVGMLADALSAMVDILRPIVSAVGEFNDALGGIPVAVAGAALALGGLGKVASKIKLPNIFGSWSRDAGREGRKAGQNYAGGLDRGARRPAETAGRKIGGLVGRGLRQVPLLGLGIWIGEEIASGITGQQEDFSETLGKLFDTKQIVQGTATAVVTAEEFAARIGAISESVGSVFGGMASGVGSSLSELGGIFASQLPGIGEAWNALFSGMGSTQSQFWAQAAIDATTGSSLFQTAVSSAANLASSLWGTGLEGMRLNNLNVWGGIAADTGLWSQDTANRARAAGEGMRASWQSIVERTRAVTSSVWGTIANDVGARSGDAASRAAAAASRLASGWSSGVNRTASANSSAWARVVDGTRAGADRALAQAVRAAGQIAASWSGMSSSGYSAGYNAGAGVAAGIRAAAQMAIAEAKRMADQVAAAVAGLWRIASPSKLFAEFGEYAALGIAQGIQRGTATAVTAAATMARQAATAAQNAAQQVARSVMSPVQTAAREMLDALNRDVTFFEDFSFKGASKLVADLNDEFAKAFYRLNPNLDFGTMRARDAVERFLREVAASGSLGVGPAVAPPRPARAAASVSTAAGDYLRPVVVNQTFTTPAADPRSVAAMVDARLQAALAKV